MYNCISPSICHCPSISCLIRQTYQLSSAYHIGTMKDSINLFIPVSVLYLWPGFPMPYVFLHSMVWGERWMFVLLISVVLLTITAFWLQRKMTTVILRYIIYTQELTMKWNNYNSGKCRKRDNPLITRFNINMCTFVSLYYYGEIV